MVDEKELEKRLEEAVEKKKPTVKGTAFTSDLKKMLSRYLLRNPENLKETTDTVDVRIEDRALVIEARPKHGWEFRWEERPPLVIRGKLTLRDIELINRYPATRSKLENLIREIIDMFITDYYGRYVKPMYVFRESILSGRIGGPTRAKILMANLAKMGSPWHASYLAGALSSLVNKWSKEERPGVREFLIQGLSDIGFPTLESMLYAINPEEVPSSELSEFVLLVSEGIKDTLSQYARVYGSPDMLTEEDKRKTLEICDEMARMPRARWVAPVTFDESPLITILTRNRDLIPTIWEIISPIISERKEVIEELKKEEKRKEAFAEEVAKTVAEELRKKKLSERELIDLIKEEILKRMGQI